MSVFDIERDGGGVLPVGDGIVRVCPEVGVSGLCLEAGTEQGQILTIINASSKVCADITFAPDDQSKVFDASDEKIAYLTCERYVWVQAQERWYNYRKLQSWLLWPATWEVQPPSYVPLWYFAVGTRSHAHKLGLCKSGQIELVEHSAVQLWKLLRQRGREDLCVFVIERLTSTVVFLVNKDNSESL